MQVRAGVIATPPPPEAWMFDWVYAEPPRGLGPDARRGARMSEWTMSGALNRGAAATRSSRIRACWCSARTSAAAAASSASPTASRPRTGAARVFDTPISEAGITGVAVGLCFAGWRPVVELQFDAFSYPAFDQVIDHVAKMRNRTRGRVDMPITIRIPRSAASRAKEHHGESPETYYAHTAGLKVVVPSSALDAYRLLRQAIADPDPVVFLEPKARYWSKEDRRAVRRRAGPIGEGRVVRSGDDCHDRRVRGDGQPGARRRRGRWPTPTASQARVVDLRSLSPLDDELLARCARETGRVVVVHEAPRTLGVGAEVAARVMELAFDHLEAPVARVTGWDVPYPPASLEQHYLPSVERIVEAVRAVSSY